LDRGTKSSLIRNLSDNFSVAAETGAKDASVPVVLEEWVAEMLADLEAGATWLVTEGRESGTVGIYGRDGAVHTDMIEAFATRLPIERVIFEAPAKAQQAWFVTSLGPHVNLGNIAPDDVLPLETLRLGLRADTALHPSTSGADPSTSGADGGRMAP
jgi:phosphosulfolactate synthase